jgi:hypothetical protein
MVIEQGAGNKGTREQGNDGIGSRASLINSLVKGHDFKRATKAAK